jgi:hypothetical protein
VNTQHTHRCTHIRGGVYTPPSQCEAQSSCCAARPMATWGWEHLPKHTHPSHPPPTHQTKGNQTCERRAPAQLHIGNTVGRQQHVHTCRALQPGASPLGTSRHCWYVATTHAIPVNLAVDWRPPVASIQQPTPCEGPGSGPSAGQQQGSRPTARQAAQPPQEEGAHHFLPLQQPPALQMPALRNQQRQPAWLVGQEASLAVWREQATWL